MTYLATAVGGSARALARYLVDGWVTGLMGEAFPWGTLVINVTGAFLLGMLATLAMERSVLPPEIRPPLMIGFLGTYTTFSTWMLESWRLMEQGAVLATTANIIGSVVLGIAAIGTGIALGRVI